MKKSILFSLFALVLVIPCFALFAGCGPSDPGKGKLASDNVFYYQLDDDKTHYSITGLKNTSASALTIPATFNNLPVTEIEYNAFKNNANIRSVVFGDNLDEIESGAFQNCTGIEELSFPGSLGKIDSWAFAGCTSLEKVTIGDDSDQGKYGIETGNDCFNGCTALEEVVIGSSAGYIHESSFNDCDNIKKYTGNLYGLGNMNRASLETVIIKSATTQNEEVGVDHFLNATNLTSITLPNNISKIEQRAFKGCTSLGTINLPNNITKIENNAFYGSGLTSITLPSELTCIEYDAFKNCASLQTINFNSKLEEVRNCAFENCTNLSSLSLPSTETDFWGEAFKGCTGLTGNLIIPANVTLGEKCFENCTGISKVTIQNSTAGVNNNTFNGCTTLTEVNVPSSHALAIMQPSVQKIVINSGTTLASGQVLTTNNVRELHLNSGITQISTDFTSFSKLEKVYVPTITQWLNIDFNLARNNPLNFGPRGTEESGAGLYIGASSTPLTELEVPTSVTALKQYTFINYDKLTSVAIPTVTGVTGSINLHTFDNCDGITDLAFSTNWLETYATTKVRVPTTNIVNFALTGGTNVFPTGIFNGSTTLKTLSVTGVTAGIAASAFADCSELTRVTFPFPAYTIGEKAFKNCAKLTTVLLNNEIKSFEDQIFNGCTLLTGVSPNSDGLHYLTNDRSPVQYIYLLKADSSVTEATLHEDTLFIGDSAFKGCPSLTEVTFSDKLVYIGCKAFNGRPLTTITLPETLKYIDSYAFAGCVVLEEIKIPNSVTTMKPYAFSSCDRLQRVELGTGLTEITYKAFEACENLKQVVVPTSVVTINADAFRLDNSGTLVKILYTGDSTQWGQIDRGTLPSNYNSTSVYYYSASQPSSGQYWRYVEEDDPSNDDPAVTIQVPTIWVIE